MFLSHGDSQWFTKLYQERQPNQIWILEHRVINQVGR
jgi:hypothetical protein